MYGQSYPCLVYGFNFNERDITPFYISNADFV